MSESVATIGRILAKVGTMFPNFDCAYDFEAASERLQGLTKELCEHAAQTHREAVLHQVYADTDLCAAGLAEHGDLVVVRDGCVRLCQAGSVVLTVEEGEAIPCLMPGLQLMSPDFAIEVECLRAVELRALPPEVGAAALAVERLYLELWSSIAAHVVERVIGFVPHSRQYAAGSTIIEQGAVATEVMTLVDGVADVFFDGVQVGEVKTDEFFGVISAITDATRTAHVVARTPCVVLAVPRQQFQALIRARPSLVEKLLGELRRTIVELNAQVAQLRRV
jgi:CRP-like cAMP-binding protein